MEEYKNFLKTSLDLKKAREERGRQASHDTLLKAAKKKVQTTMIGSLSDVEQFFGFLWGFGLHESELTEEQKHLKLIYKDNPRKAWRSINLTTLTSLKIGGVEWVK